VEITGASMLVLYEPVKKFRRQADAVSRHDGFQGRQELKRDRQ